MTRELSNRLDQPAGPLHYVNVFNINTEAAMDLVARVDELGKPAWIGLMVLAFILFWPAGLAMLAYLIWSGRMGCRNNDRLRRWDRDDRRAYRSAERWWSGRPQSSGNRAFDEYREETLRRLEEEQREFQGFLERLREARDKAEFDQFLAERRRRPEAPEAQPQG